MRKVKPVMLLLLGSIRKIVKHVIAKMRRQRTFGVELVDMVLKLLCCCAFELLDNLIDKRIIITQLEKIAPVFVIVRRLFYAIAIFIIIVFAYAELDRLCYITEVVQFAV